jgi:hypothetical protein
MRCCRSVGSVSGCASAGTYVSAGASDGMVALDAVGASSCLSLQFVAGGSKGVVFDGGGSRRVGSCWGAVVSSLPSSSSEGGMESVPSKVSW